MAIIFYGLICLFATTIGSISGIGGGVLIKPILDISSGMSSAEISFLSGCTVLAMSVASLLQSRKSDVKIDFRSTGILAVGSVLGGFIGKQLFSLIAEHSASSSTVSILQNGILALLTIFVALYLFKLDKIRTLKIRNPIATILIGIFLGACGSFLGIGGGPINLVILYYFFSMSVKTAALNSIFIILFSQCSSFLTTVLGGKIPEVQLATIVVMVICGIAGGIIGRKIAPKLSEKRTAKLFSAVLALIILVCIINIVRFSFLY